jgi:hypothetical protein
MRLREHPKIQWPPRWSEWGEKSLRGEEGILRDVDLIEPTKILITNELDGKVYCAEMYCFNTAFASRLREKNQAHCGETHKRGGGTRFLR